MFELDWDANFYLNEIVFLSLGLDFGEISRTQHNHISVACVYRNYGTLFSCMWLNSLSASCFHSMHNTNLICFRDLFNVALKPVRSYNHINKMYTDTSYFAKCSVLIWPLRVEISPSVSSPATWRHRTFRACTLLKSNILHEIGIQYSCRLTSNHSCVLLEVWTGAQSCW